MTKAFVCAGQSNMAGDVHRDELPESYHHWPQQVQCIGPEGTFSPLAQEKSGPEIGFAEILQALWPDEPILIVKHAIGGSNLANEWSPTGAIRQPDEPVQRRDC